MEEDTERLTLNLKRRSKRRSSILKTSAVTVPLSSIDANTQDECTVPIKKARASLPRRVSFAQLHEVKEFPRDSPHRWNDSPDSAEDKGNAAPPEKTNEVGQPEHNGSYVVPNVAENQHEGAQVLVMPSATTNPRSRVLDEGTFQAVVNSSINKYTRYVDGEASHVTEPAAARRGLQPRVPQSNQTETMVDDQDGPKIDGNLLLQSLTGGKPINFIDNRLQGETCLEDSDDVFLNRNDNAAERRVDGTALLRSLSGVNFGKSSNREPDRGYVVSYTADGKGDTTDRTSGQPTFLNKTVVFDDGDDNMEQTEALTGHLQLGDTSDLKNETLDFEKVTSDKCPNTRTQLFSSDDDMEQTDVLVHQSPGPISKSTGRSGLLDGHSLLKSLGKFDETDDPEVIFAKKFVKSSSPQDDQTVIFQANNEMEETEVLSRDIWGTDRILQCDPVTIGAESREVQLQPTEDKTVVFQENDIEETCVLPSNIINKSNLTADLNLSDRLGVNTAENFVSLGRNSHDSRVGSDNDRMVHFPYHKESTQTGPTTKSEQVDVTTLLHQDMEETGVIRQERNLTTFCSQGADMEETGVLDVIINRPVGNCTGPDMQSLASPEHNTISFYLGDTTEDLKNVPANPVNKSLTQVPGNKTLLFPDGKDMEETEIVKNTIANRSIVQESAGKILCDRMTQDRSLPRLSGNKTLLFQDGKDMEETQVVKSTILNRSMEQQFSRKILAGQENQNEYLARLPVNKTLMFQDGNDMEETQVVKSTILNRCTEQQSIEEMLFDQTNQDRSLPRLSGNKTLMFQDGKDMEETEIVKNTIANRSIVQESAGKMLCDRMTQDRSLPRLSGNKTLLFQDGKDMEETQVVKSTILNRSMEQQFSRKILAGQENQNESLARLPVNKTLMFQDGGNMEQTEVLQNNILSRRDAECSGGKTLIFEDGVDMEETGAGEGNLSYRSTARSSANKSLLFKDSGEMEQAGVLVSLITGIRFVDGQKRELSLSRQMRPPQNKTVWADGTCIMDKSQTIVTCNNKTMTFPGGMDMEQTAVLEQEHIMENLEAPHLSDAPVKSVPVQDGLQVKTSQGHRQNKTILFQDVDMDETHATTSHINKSVAKDSYQVEHITEKLEAPLSDVAVKSVPEQDGLGVKTSQTHRQNKTILFQDVDMDETHATTSHINKSVAKDSLQVDVETDQNLTKEPSKVLWQANNDVTTSNKMLILAQQSARLKKLSGRLSFGVDNVTARLSVGGPAVDGDQTQTTPSRNVVRLATPTPKTCEDKTHDLLTMEGTSAVSRGCDAGLISSRTRYCHTDMESEHGMMKPSEVQPALNQSLSWDTVKADPPDGAQTRCTPSRNVIRLATPTPNKCEDKTQDVFTEKGMDMGITDILPPADLGITDMLPPIDLFSSIMSHASVLSSPGDLSMLSKATDSSLQRKDSRSSDSSQSRSIQINNLQFNSSINDSIMQREGPLTVKKMCPVLELLNPMWMSDLQFKFDRCSILPGEQVDTSDLRSVLTAQVIRCPFYVVHAHDYSQAAILADQKKKTAEELDVQYSQTRPELFRIVEHGTKEQKAALRERVSVCCKVCSQLGKKAWKDVRMQTTQHNREILQVHHTCLQLQAEQVSTVLHQTDMLCTVLDTAMSELDVIEAELENTKSPSEEEIQQWASGREELALKSADLHVLEEEQKNITRERDSFRSELVILRDSDQQSASKQNGEVKQRMDRLKLEESDINQDFLWMERCLEWKVDVYEKEKVSYLFYKDSLLLETTLDTSHHRRLLSVTIKSLLPEPPSTPRNLLEDKSEEIMGLIHRLIMTKIQEQNLLTKFIATPLKEQHALLRDVSVIVCTGRSLGREIADVEFNTWVTMQDQGVNVEFWCEEALRKMDVQFDFKLKYHDYSVSPTVRVDIGKFRPEDVLKQLSAVPEAGFRYFERLCTAVNLQDMTAIPSLDQCS